MVFNYILVGCPWTQTKRKERSISCIAIADIIDDQVEAMVLIKETRAQVLLTLLLQRQTNPTWLIFCLRNGKTKISLIVRQLSFC